MERLKRRKIFSFKSKGKPSGRGTEKAGIKTAGVDHLDMDEEIAEKYTDGQDEIPAENLYQRHPNRHYHKTEIDKPSYS